MQKRWFWLMAILLLAVIPLAAQDDTPAAVRESALDAGEAALGVRAENWRYQSLNRTSDSALGCPLVEGEEMPVEVTVYRVELIYPEGVYVVHVSADGRMVQLCDSKFGDAMTTEANSEDDPNACTVTPNAAVPAYAAPNNTVPGIFTAVAGTAYEPFGRSSDGDWYQIANDVGVGWVDRTQVTVTGDCSELAVNAFTAPDYTGAACFVSAAAAFSNVRSQPTTDAAQVAQVFENVIYQVTARNTPADWYYIQPGWVAARVTLPVGDCSAVTVNDSIVGTGFTAELPGDLDESVARALAEYPCAADFEGYLRPRLSLGFANAQVRVSGVPNSLRSYPNTDDSIGTRLGVIQPGRTIDRIISGPACNQGFVWWLVEFDGTVGWTAESNVATNEYFIEPMNSDQPATTATTTPSAATSTDNAITINENPITGLVFNEDGSRLFIGAQEQGFGDAISGFVSVWNMDAGASEGRIDVPTGIAALDYAVEADLLMVASNGGVVTFYTASEADLPAESTVDTAFEGDLAVTPDLALSPDGSYFAILECAADDCATSQLRVLNVADGTQRFMVDFDAVMNAVAISRDGEMIAVAGNTGVSFVNVDDGTESSFYSVGDDSSLPMLDIAFNADGLQVLFAGCKTLASDGCTLGRVDLLNVTNATLVGAVEAHTGSQAQIVVYNPDGTRFVTSSSEDELILRNSATGIDIVTYNTGASVTSLTFTPDGTNIVAGTENGQVLFFDATVAEN